MAPWRVPACCMPLVLLLLVGGAGLASGAAAPAPSSSKDICADASYKNRIDNKDYYNWCLVPHTSYDVVLFGGLAVVLACLLQGKLNTLMVLAAGAVLMAIAWPVNLGALGNSLAIWLGISPWQLFFYVFLPPLLLDAAVRIDWYLFKKSVVQVFTLAFLVVGATCVAMVPIMLYMLDLRKYGWEWIHACMFGAMIASTDAVAIVSIMKTGGGPKRLRVLLEGESLLNDASGLTLFEVFFHILQEQLAHPEHKEAVGVIVGHVFVAVIQLGMIGFVLGMVFGVLTRLFLRFMRYAGAGHDQEVALTLGMAYLAYWVTGIPCKGSGVVAVAVMGLYGASTNCWDMSTAAHHTFDGFWETLAFAVNALVFMWSGAHVVNFFIRASVDLHDLGLDHDLSTTLWMMPVIYIILMLLRFGLTAMFRPLFMLIKGDINTKECIFVTFAGLRGSASLIMGSAVVTQQFATYAGQPDTFSVVKSMMVFWTAGFVLLTLAINAPLLPFVLRVTGLSKVPVKQLERRQRAVAALADHSRLVLEQLRDAEDELLAGVDWGQVAAFVDHGRKYSAFTGHPTPPGPLASLTLRLWALACCCCPCLPPWLTGRSAAAAAAEPRQLGNKGDASRHHDQGPEPGHGGGSHHSKSSHRHRRQWGKRQGHRSPHSAAADGQQQGSKGALPVVVAAAAGDAGVAALPAPLTAFASQEEAAVGPAVAGKGSVAAPGPYANGAAAGAAARLTGDSQGRLWGSGREETTDAERAGGGSSGNSSSSEGSDTDEDLGGAWKQQQRQRSTSRSRLGGGSGSHARRRERRRQAQLRHVSGDVSDSEGSSSESGSDDSSSSSSSSSGQSRVSRYSSNLITDILPFLQAHEVDVMQQECPFLMSSAMQQQQQHQQRLAAAGAAGDTWTGGSQQQQQSGGQPVLPLTQKQQHKRQKGVMGLFERWRKPSAGAAAAAGAAAGSVGGSSRAGSAAGIELQGASDTSARRQQQGGSAPNSPKHPAVAAAAASSAFEPRARSSIELGSSQPPLSAYAAASASRGLQGVDSFGASGMGRPAGPGRGVSRSLASRSAAPALIYGSRASYPGGPPSGEDPATATAAGSASTQPGHRRKGSDGAGLGPSAAAGTGSGAPAAAGSWGLAGTWSTSPQLESSGSGAVAAAAASLRSSSAVGGSAAAAAAGARALQSGTEKALGRRSGMFGPAGRSLGTQSTSLAERYGGGGPDSFTSSFQPFHLPEAEAAEGAPLARRSRTGPDAQGGARALRRASSERQRDAADRNNSWDAAAVAVDMVALERSSSSRTRTGVPALPALPAPGGNSSPTRAGSRGLASRSVGLAGAYGPTGGSDGGQQRQERQERSRPPSTRLGPSPGLEGKSLATRSTNPHLPPVAPIAPSLATISTGLAAYNKSTAAGADGSRQPQGLPWGPSGKAERSLATQSVPAAGIVAAAAAAAAATAGAAAPRSNAACSTDGSTGGAGAGSSGNLLSMLRSSIGISRASAKSGRGPAGRAFTDEDGDSDADGMSDAAKPSGVPQMCDADLADARSWLVMGLKRYFHAKRMEGLLSARGLRILDNACEVLLEAPQKPLHLWSILRGDCANSTFVGFITYLLFGCRQAAVGMMTWGRVGRLLAWPLKVAASMLQRPLNKVLLMSVEVAMEYLMGLTTSPHVEQLQENEAWAALLAEISAEAGQVAQFLIDREIEAPERYSAVQSYRVAMAVLRQQRLFVETLFESGMLDATETSALSHPVESAERRLGLLGPVWRAPSVMEVLRQLPFLRGQPPAMVEFFVRHGQLVMLGSGSSLKLDKVLYVVQSGIVKVTYSPNIGEVQEYFLGSGGLINLYGSLTGESMPGVADAVAQGNALGKGPVLFCLGAKGLRRMASAAAAGDPAFQQLELDMYRLAGLFLLERLKPQLDMEASQALARLAPLTTTAGGAGGGRDAHRDKRSSRQQRAAWVRQKLCVMRAALKGQLVLSELLVLSEGASVVQDSHVILMKGSIQVKVADEAVLSQPGAADIARWMANAGRHQHQSILPWFWDLLSDEDLQRAPAGTPQQPLPVTIAAGCEGATLLVCPSRFDDLQAQLAAGSASGHHPLSASNSLLIPSRRGSVQGPNSLLDPSQGPAGDASAPSSRAPGQLARRSPNLARISPSGHGPGYAPVGAIVGPAGLGGAGASRVAQNTYSRRNLAAAVAAADALMDPLPLSASSARSGLAAGSSSAARAGGTPAGVAPPPVSRVSPSAGGSSAHSRSNHGSLEQQGRAAGAGGAGASAGEAPPGLQRTSSNLPLAGAQVDTAASLGVDMRAGPVGSLGLSSDLGSAAAARSAAARMPQQPAAAAGGVQDGSGAGQPASSAPPAAAAAGAAADAGADDKAPAAAARGSRGQQLRRSRSMRPLQGPAVAQGGERHVGGRSGSTTQHS